MTEAVKRWPGMHSTRQAFCIGSARLVCCLIYAKPLTLQVDLIRIAGTVVAMFGFVIVRNLPLGSLFICQQDAGFRLMMFPALSHGLACDAPEEEA
ncbi:hypothetical protein [Alcanivorax sp.]|uniref:hypothetical protein n=1 Tax=Alcanivorax sp. TaxID=1872427 RepID=UPI0025C05F57|nr:hypothetical protein [Alcanivorax sp.]